MKLSFSKLLLLFVLVPFVELYLLLRIAEWTSPLTTFGIIITTGVCGAYFAKQQGRSVLSAINRDLDSGRTPTDSMVAGLCVLAGGIMLLTPGVLTDLFGFALVLPWSRRYLAAALKRKLSSMVNVGKINYYTTGQYDNRSSDARDDVADDDIVIIDDWEDKPKH